MHRGCRGVNRESVRGVYVLLKLAFELGRFRACRQPPRLKRVDNLVDLFLADRWHVKRYEWHLLHVFLYGSASEAISIFRIHHRKDHLLDTILARVEDTPRLPTAVTSLRDILGLGASFDFCNLYSGTRAAR